MLQWAQMNFILSCLQVRRIKYARGILLYNLITFPLSGVDSLKPNKNNCTHALKQPINLRVNSMKPDEWHIQRR